MRYVVAILLGFVALGAVVVLVANLDGRGELAGAERSGASGSEETAVAVAARAPRSSTSVLARPRQGSPRDGHSPHDGFTAAELDAVLAASHHPDKLLRLKELATGGNGYAAVAVGRSLLECTPRALEINRYHMGRLQSQAEQLKLRLLGGPDSIPAPAASIDTLTMQIAGLESETDMRDQLPKKCERPELNHPWSGFDWIARAAEMGHKQARIAFVDKVVEFFGRPRQVARYPERAIALRNRARTYVEQLKAECTRQALTKYAWWSVALYKLDVEERYARVFTWIRLQEEFEDYDPRSGWGTTRVETLERLITPERRRRADRGVQAMLDRCGIDA